MKKIAKISSIDIYENIARHYTERFNSVILIKFKFNIFINQEKYSLCFFKKNVDTINMNKAKDIHTPELSIKRNSTKKKAPNDEKNNYVILLQGLLIFEYRK